MVKLVWDKVGERLYETGTSKGALFVRGSAGTYGPGVAWNGLSAVRQSPDGAEESPVYANNKKYLSMLSAENFKGTIEAYTYPEEFSACDGSKEVVPGVYLGQQARSTFGLVYSTIVGNDTSENAYGEKLHFIYGAKVSPSERSYETVNEDPNAILLSWEFNTEAQTVEAAGFTPTAYLVVDSTKTDTVKFQALHDLVYGTVEGESELPSIDDIIALVTAE